MSLANYAPSQLLPVCEGMWTSVHPAKGFYFAPPTTSPPSSTFLSATDTHSRADAYAPPTMHSPTADEKATRPSRIPRLPNPPSSRRPGMERRPASHAATTGSPRPAAYTPASRGVMSPTPDSKIPKAAGKQLTTHQKGHEQEQQQRQMSDGAASVDNANILVQHSPERPNSHELEQAVSSAASVEQSILHQTSHDPKQVESSTASAEHSTQDGESSGSPHGGFTWRSSSEYWEKQMPHEPTLRIHRDAPDVLFGDSSQLPKDLPKPATSRSSFRTSLGTLAQQTKSSIGLALSSSMDLPPPTTTTREAVTTPVVISPIRSMQRQGVRNFSTPTRRPARPAQTGGDVAPIANEITPVTDGIAPIANETAPIVDEITPAAPTENAADPDSDGEQIDFWAALNETAPQEKKKRARGVGFMTATTSFAGRVSERKSISDLKLKAKQSLRSLFSKDEESSSEPKRSLTTTTRTLARRLSRNFSRVHIPAVPADELRNLEQLTRRQSALTLTALALTPEPLAHYTVQTAATVNHIVASIAAATTTGAQAHRLASIAGALLDMVEIGRENEEMRQMAFQAQLEVLAGSERLGHVKARLGTLLQGEFEDPVMRGLMDRLGDLV
ncbi:hypothetical protein HBI50_205990 [Parastagonospora nodorum]|nr:hypothetical protein HBI50_205990 [Parastagonospora nodorum]